MNTENIWSVSLVFQEKDEENEGKTRLVAYSTPCVASDYNEALGYALSSHKQDLEQGKKILVAFDADEQAMEDLAEMMKRKGWQPKKK